MKVQLQTQCINSLLYKKFMWCHGISLFVCLFFFKGEYNANECPILRCNGMQAASKGKHQSVCIQIIVPYNKHASLSPKRRGNNQKIIMFIFIKLILF